MREQAILETFNIIGQQIDAVHNGGNDRGMDDKNEDRNGETAQSRDRRRQNQTQTITATATRGRWEEMTVE